MAKKSRSGGTARTAAPKPKPAMREVDGIFLDREHLNQALSALSKAGFGYDRMTAVLERHVGGHRVAVTDLPPAGFSQTDKRQLRTLTTSLSAAIGALAAFGVTIASGGAAAAAVAAAALAGGASATGVNVFKKLHGFDKIAEDIILSVRVEKPGDEERVAEIFHQHGAEQIWAQNRPY